jgi:hypothetical protein
MGRVYASTMAALNAAEAGVVVRMADVVQFEANRDRPDVVLVGPTMS